MKEAFKTTGYLYSGMVGLAGMTVLAISFLLLYNSGPQEVLLVLAAAVMLPVIRFAVRHRSSVAFLFGVLLAVAFLRLGIGGMTIVGTMAAILSPMGSDSRRHSMTLHTAAMCLATFLAAGSLAAVARFFRLTIPTVPGYGRLGLPLALQVILPTMGVMVIWLLQRILLSTGDLLEGRNPFAESFLRELQSTFFSFAGGGALGGALAASTSLWGDGGLIVAFALLTLGYHLAESLPDLLGSAFPGGKRLLAMQRSIIETLSNAVSAKGVVSPGHARRVEALATGIAVAAGVEDIEELETIRLAALMHDVGKMLIPDQILNKPGALSPAEIECVRLHCKLGRTMLSYFDLPYAIAPLVEAHHEFYDGSGYPHGLSGEEIPFGARALALANFYDGLRSGGRGRPGRSVAEAKQVLLARTERFDPELLAVFLANLEELEEARRQVEEELNLTEPLRLAGALGRDQSPRDAKEEAQAALDRTWLLDLYISLIGTLEYRDLLQICVRKLSPEVPISTAMFLLKARGDDRLRVVAVCGEMARELSGATLRLGEGLSGRTVADGRPRTNEDADEELLALSVQGLSSPGAKALVHPLLQRGNMLGALVLIGPPDCRFDERAISLVEMAIPHLAKAVNNAVRFDHYRETSLTDTLTGLPNARMLYKQGAKLIEQVERAGEELILLMMDLDGFKGINDRFGHAAGDQMIRSIGRLLRGCLRGNDKVYRYAGDEFVALLHNCDPRMVRLVIDRIQSRVDGFSLQFGPNALGRVGISIGHARLGEDGQTLDELMNRADKRMYCNKVQRKERRRRAPDKREPSSGRADGPTLAILEQPRPGAGERDESTAELG
jgi:diguanylate cyclase (GGDEF)-like protein